MCASLPGPVSSLGTEKTLLPQTALPPSASQEAWLTSADRAMWFVNSWEHGGKQVKFSKGRFWSSEFLL